MKMRRQEKIRKEKIEMRIEERALGYGPITCGKDIGF
jgi:hypothetical protein